MIQLRHPFAVSILSAGVFALLAGCADVGGGDDEANQTPPTTNPTVEVVADHVTAKDRPPVIPLMWDGEPQCPNARSPGTPAFYQSVATRVAHYLLGGADPFNGTFYPKGTPRPDMTNSVCNFASYCIGIVRANIQTKDISVSSPVSATVCGLRASTFTLTPANGVTEADLESMSRCSAALDDCWSVGVSGFFYATTENNQRVIKIDPEPARLTAALTGSTGATAAAVYQNTAAETNVVKWGTAYTTPSFTLTAGTPCANGDLPIGEQTNKIIQALGNGRRCY